MPKLLIRIGAIGLVLLSVCVCSLAQEYTPGNNNVTGNLNVTGNATIGTSLPAGAPSGTAGSKVFYTPATALNVKAFGAICDGTSRPLSGIYGSLGAAQAVYPPVTALNQELDWAAIQTALNQVSTGLNGAVYIPGGSYCQEKHATVTVPGNVGLVGDGLSSIINQLDATANGVTLASTNNQLISDINITSEYTMGGGPASGTSSGIALFLSSVNTPIVRDVWLQGFSGGGLVAANVIEGRFSDIVADQVWATCFTFTTALRNTSIRSSIASGCRGYGYDIQSGTDLSLNDAKVSSTNATGGLSGFHFGSGASEITCTACVSGSAQQHGFLVDGTATHINFVNSIADGNGQATSNTYDGFHLASNGNITLAGSVASGGHQRYGYASSVAVLNLAGGDYAGLTAASTNFSTLTNTLVPSTQGAILAGACSGTISNAATVQLWPFQAIGTTCGQVTSFLGLGIRGGIVKNLRVNNRLASITAGSGIVTVSDNGVPQAVTCTLGANVSGCQDLTHSFIASVNDQISISVQSLGGIVSVGPTYASGSTGCTNGTQVVTFTNNSVGTAATGTITITATVPVGAVTITSGGTGYTAGTPPTTGTIATCTGTATFTGGTATSDALSQINASIEIF